MKGFLPEKKEGVFAAGLSSTSHCGTAKILFSSNLRNPESFHTICTVSLLTWRAPATDHNSRLAAPLSTAKQETVDVALSRQPETVMKQHPLLPFKQNKGLRGEPSRREKESTPAHRRHFTFIEIATRETGSAIGNQGIRHSGSPSFSRKGAILHPSSLPP